MGGMDIFVNNSFFISIYFMFNVILPPNFIALGWINKAVYQMDIDCRYLVYLSSATRLHFHGTWRDC